VPGGEHVDVVSVYGFLYLRRIAGDFNRCIARSYCVLGAWRAIPSFTHAGVLLPERIVCDVSFGAWATDGSERPIFSGRAMFTGVGLVLFLMTNKRIKESLLAHGTGPSHYFCRSCSATYLPELVAGWLVLPSLQASAGAGHGW
jgi:hypothetical protein